MCRSQKYHCKDESRSPYLATSSLDLPSAVLAKQQPHTQALPRTRPKLSLTAPKLLHRGLLQVWRLGAAADSSWHNLPASSTRRALTTAGGSPLPLPPPPAAAAADCGAVACSLLASCRYIIILYDSARNAAP
jgi:hypothetical protein